MSIIEFLQNISLSATGIWAIYIILCTLIVTSFAFVSMLKDFIQLFRKGKRL